MGTIIGLLMEPDVGDSASYNGTIYQYGLLKYDPQTKNFPPVSLHWGQPQRAFFSLPFTT